MLRNRLSCLDPALRQSTAPCLSPLLTCFDYACSSKNSAFPSLHPQCYGVTISVLYPLPPTRSTMLAPNTSKLTTILSERRSSMATFSSNSFPLTTRWLTSSPRIASHLHTADPMTKLQVMLTLPQPYCISHENMKYCSNMNNSVIKSSLFYACKSLYIMVHCSPQ